MEQLGTSGSHGRSNQTPHDSGEDSDDIIRKIEREFIANRNKKKRMEGMTASQRGSQMSTESVDDVGNQLTTQTADEGLRMHSLASSASRNRKMMQEIA